MSRPTSAAAKRKQFFDRLLAEESSITQILKDMGVSQLEFARWRRSIPFRIRLNRYLRNNRQVARLELRRSGDVAAKHLAEKAVTMPEDAKGQKQTLEVVKMTRAIEPDQPRAAREQTDPTGGAVPHMSPQDLARSLQEIKSPGAADANH